MKPTQRRAITHAPRLYIYTSQRVRLDVRVELGIKGLAALGRASTYTCRYLLCVARVRRHVTTDIVLRNTLRLHYYF